MNIIYSGGANINVANIIPSDNPITTKTFTVTGNNTTDIEMYYKISLVVETNTFSEEALKYKLISTNTGANGIVAPSITRFTNIGTGAKTIELGVGEFDSPTEGNKVHTYNLELYFPETRENQNIDQEKVLRAHINIENYIQTLKDKILAQDGGSVAIEAKGNPNFAQIATTMDSGLYATEDEYGTSYYYRGVRETLNNNLLFGGFQWKIIRINGDGSVRILYNGTETEFNINGTTNALGGATQIIDVPWNQENFNDAKYVGYMYGGTNGVTSTQRNGTESTAATYNETNNNVKNHLDDWYQTNIAGKPFENKILDNLFCNDRQLQSEVGGVPTGYGYGNATEITYAASFRLDTTKMPTLKCNLKNDRFTKGDIINGNGVLTYSIGLISADEVSMGGLVWGTENTTSYLYTNQYYWTLTPRHVNEVGHAGMLSVYSNGYLSSRRVDIESAVGIRPILSISPEITVTGEGTATNPYIVE